MAWSVCSKLFPTWSRGQAEICKHLLVIEEARHGHVGADTVLVAAGKIRAAFLHGRNQAVPPLAHVVQREIFALIDKLLLIGRHDIRHRVGSELDLDDVARVLLVLLLDGDAIGLRGNLQ